MELTITPTKELTARLDKLEAQVNKILALLNKNGSGTTTHENHSDNNLNIKDGLYQAKDAAKIFAVSKSTWFNWRAQGHISEGILIGEKRRAWTGEELQDLYRRMKNGEFAIGKAAVS